MPKHDDSAPEQDLALKNGSPDDDEVIDLLEVVRPGKILPADADSDDVDFSKDLESMLDSLSEAEKNRATSFPDPTPVDHEVDHNESLDMPDMDDLDELLHSLGADAPKKDTADDLASDAPEADEDADLPDLDAVPNAKKVKETPNEDDFEALMGPFAAKPDADAADLDDDALLSEDMLEPARTDTLAPKTSPDASPDAVLDAAPDTSLDAAPAHKAKASPNGPADTPLLDEAAALAQLDAAFDAPASADEPQHGGLDDSALHDVGLDEAEVKDSGVGTAGLDDAGLDDAGLDDVELDDVELDDAGLDEAGPDDVELDDVEPSAADVAAFNDVPDIQEAAPPKAAQPEVVPDAAMDAAMDVAMDAAPVAPAAPAKPKAARPVVSISVKSVSPAAAPKAPPASAAKSTAPDATDAPAPTAPTAPIDTPDAMSVASASDTPLEAALDTALGDLTPEDLDSPAPEIAEQDAAPLEPVAPTAQADTTTLPDAHAFATDAALDADMSHLPSDAALDGDEDPEPPVRSGSALDEVDLVELDALLDDMLAGAPAPGPGPGFAESQPGAQPAAQVEAAAQSQAAPPESAAQADAFAAIRAEVDSLRGDLNEALAMIADLKDDTPRHVPSLPAASSDLAGRVEDLELSLTARSEDDASREKALQLHADQIGLLDGRVEGLEDMGEQMALMAARLDTLENSVAELTANLDKLAAEAAAKVIREELAALLAGNSQ